jgi:hypothetical protein
LNYQETSDNLAFGFLVLYKKIPRLAVDGGALIVTNFLVYLSFRHLFFCLHCIFWWYNDFASLVKTSIFISLNSGIITFKSLELDGFLSHRIVDLFFIIKLLVFSFKRWFSTIFFIYLILKCIMREEAFSTFNFELDWFYRKHTDEVTIPMLIFFKGKIVIMPVHFNQIASAIPLSSNFSVVNYSNRYLTMTDKYK